MPSASTVPRSVTKDDFAELGLIEPGFHHDRVDHGDRGGGERDARDLCLRPGPADHVTRGQHAAEIGQQETDEADSDARPEIAAHHLHIHFGAGATTISIRATESASRIEISDEASARPIHTADTSQMLSIMKHAPLRAFGTRPMRHQKRGARIDKENPPRSTYDSYRSSRSGRSHQPLRAVSGDSIPITGKLSGGTRRVNGEVADKLPPVH
jgi:hypothetical protein